MNDELKTKLKELGLTDEEIGKLEKEGVVQEADMALLSAEDVKGVAGCGLVAARKVAAAFKPAPEAPVALATTASLDAILPSVPDDESWLKALRAGGILKIEQSTVISAIRAALAHRAGLYEIPQKLVAAMEAYTDETEEQVGPQFFALRKLITRTDYGDLFAAIDGLDGTFVTKGRKQELLTRIGENLWSSVVSFNDQLASWQNAWMQGMANPATIMATFLGGAGAGALPPGFMQAPETGNLRDSAEAVTDDINRIFRGTGVQVAAALAYEANRIKEVLGNPELPKMIGTPNREQMLKKLGVAVPATYPRLEQNLTQFVLAVMQAPDISADEELRYFGALFTLGSQIDWNQLGVMGHRPGRAAIGSGKL